MSFSHREEKRGDRLLDVLTDEIAGLRITVSRLGAELVSLARRDAAGAWIGFLHRDDDLGAPAQGWANHATVMGYFLHRLKDGRSVYRGEPIEGGTHSFLRTKVWHLAEQNAGKLTYRITPADYTATEYPRKVSLDLTYALEDGAVRTSFHFTNHEPDRPAHVGFGLHPGFAITEGGNFTFRMPPGLYRRHFSPTNYLSGETEDVQHAGGDMPFEKTKLVGSYILELVDVPQRDFAFADGASGRRVDFDLREVPYLTLWADSAAFLCVEPCWGLTDHDAQRTFEQKEGIQLIPAGGSLTRSFRMTPQLAFA